MVMIDTILKDFFSVSETDLSKAKEFQNKHGGRLENILINIGGLDEDLLPDFYHKFLGVELLSENAVYPTEDEIKNFPNEKHVLAALDWYFINDSSIGCLDPLNFEASQFMGALDKEYQLFIITKNQAQNFSELYLPDADSRLENQNENLTLLEEDKLRELASEAPVVNLFNKLVSKALKASASDMHIEPIEGRLRVRFRVDGVLHSEEYIPSNLQVAIITRLKILSNMDIAEKRRPQDGKIELKILQEELDIRVSALPLQNGESIVLRFLRKEAVKFELGSLGIEQDIIKLIQEDLTKTAGVILLTGPTGSGKTTTLYSFLNQLNSDAVKIITLEDPVEYQVDGINQVQVNPEIGFDFSAGLRSIVRQDPDIIMLGEIRDAETAKIALQSALTGHLVFSTVHTNDAPSAFTRLMDLGVEPFLLDAALVAILAQRLARKLCDNCSTPLDQEELDTVYNQYPLQKIEKQFLTSNINLKKAVGCECCGHSGYTGRVALIEYLRCDQELNELEKDESFISKARALNLERNCRTLYEDGLLKALKGITTIEEVVRVAG
jgi:general secretion pathway protein E